MLFGKYKNIALLIVLLLAAWSCTKDKPSAWQKDNFIKCFGPAYQNEATDFITDNDFFYILGNIQVNDNNGADQIYQLFVAKTDNFGNKIWEKTFTQDNKQSEGYQIIKLEKQNGFAVIGGIESDNDSLYFDPYLVIFDEEGNLIKEKVLEYAGTNDIGKCLAETDDGGFTISILSTQANQISNSQIFCTTNNSDGDLLEEVIRIKGTDIFQICKKSDNTGFYITAYDNKPMILILGLDGKSQGYQSFVNIAGEIHGIIQNSEGKTFVSGKITNGSHGKNDGFIAELTDVENSIDNNWLEEFGGIENDNFNDIIITENNEIVTTGSITNSILNTSDIWMVKTDLQGHQISENKIGGDYDETGIRILELPENRFLVESTMNFDKQSLIAISVEKIE